MYEIGQDRRTSIFKYRMGRKTYWISVAGLTAGVLLLSIFMAGYSGGGTLFVWLMLYAWRLHDFGRSGWWAVLAMALLTALGVSGAILAPNGMVYLFGEVDVPEPSSRELIIGGVFGFGMLLLQLAFTIWLGLRPGDPGENRYGWPKGMHPRIPAKDFS